MKKLTRSITAITTAAIMTLSASMTASGYYVNKSDYVKSKRAFRTYNFSTEPARGYGWDTPALQKALPMLNKDLFEYKNNIVLLSPVDTAGNEYGNGHMLALFDKDVITSATISNAMKYVNNVSIKYRTDLTCCLEYHNYSYDDVYPDDPDPDYVDYGLRMIGDNETKALLNKFYVNNLHKEADGSYTGEICLDNYYIQNLHIGCLDTNVRFEEPVLERRPSGIGFRTKAKFRVKKPASVNGNYTILNDVRFIYYVNTQQYYTTSHMAKTVNFG